MLGTNPRNTFGKRSDPLPQWSSDESESTSAYCSYTYVVDKSYSALRLRGVLTVVPLIVEG